MPAKVGRQALAKKDPPFSTRRDVVLCVVKEKMFLKTKKNI